MRTRAFSNDPDADSENGSSDTGSSDARDDEFVFDGFKVMFVEKVMLTPAAPSTPAAPATSVMPQAPLTQTQSRRWH